MRIKLLNDLPVNNAKILGLTKDSVFDVFEIKKNKGRGASDMYTIKSKNGQSFGVYAYECVEMAD